MDEAVFELALVRVFIIMSPGRINKVYGTPFISAIRCWSVNPNMRIYRVDEIRPGKIV
jgi:hypothetical protein|tara:strand:+ start:424 stop:597 length:174 start_codon:yes stop_codon:yes gene_type:complete